MNTGIIGAGFFGAKHAQAIANVDGIDLVASSRTDEQALKSFVDRHGGTGYTDYLDLLAHDDLEAVVIATPHHTHTEIAVAAAKAGKHILLEKPMAPTAAGCDAIVEAAKVHGVTLMLGHVTRFSKAFRIAKDMLASGDLGEVVAGHSVMRKRWSEPNRRDWHLDRSRGGGVLLTGGIHALDRLGWLVGAPATSVSARLATRFHAQRADDAGVIFIRYANGAAGTIHSIGYRDGAPEHGTELTCTNGVLRVHSVRGVELGRDESWTAIEASGDANWMDQALVLEWREFLRSIESGEPPAISAQDARHMMATLFAAEESSRQGQEVRIEAA